MMEVSWPLSTVPTKEKVRWRMWLLSSERFFFSSMASSCRWGGAGGQTPVEERSWDVRSRSGLGSYLVAFDALHLFAGQRVALHDTHQRFDRCIQTLHV